MGNAKRTVMMVVVALAVTGGLWAQRPSHGGMGECLVTCRLCPA